MNMIQAMNKSKKQKPLKTFQEWCVDTVYTILKKKNNIGGIGVTKAISTLSKQLSTFSHPCIIGKQGKRPVAKQRKNTSIYGGII